MTILFLALWLRMSAPQMDFKVSTIDNINDFCAGSAQCFPLLIDPSAEGYGPLKGVPDKGKIACEIKQDHMRCINAFGDSVELKFNGANPQIVLHQFDWSGEGNGGGDIPKPSFLQDTIQTTDPPSKAVLAWTSPEKPRAADETDGKPPNYYDSYGNSRYPAEPVDVPAVQVSKKKCVTLTIDGKDHPCEWTVKAKTHTCADKSRILEHDENSPPKYWCRKVEF